MTEQTRTNRSFADEYSSTKDWRNADPHKDMSKDCKKVWHEYLAQKHLINVPADTVFIVKQAFIFAWEKSKLETF